MFDKIDFDMKHLDTLLKTFEASTIVDALHYAGKVAGTNAESYLFDAPDIFTGTRQPPYTITTKKGETKRSWFKTKKSRGYYWYQNSLGKINHPYKRTGKLEASTTHTVKLEGNDVLIQVGTNLNYAPYVVGEDQTEMHRETGWVRIDDSMEQNAAQIKADFEAAFLSRMAASLP